MHKKKTTLFIASLFIFIAGSNVFAADGSAKSFISKGDNQFIKSHLQKAQEYYQKAFSIDSTDAYTNFQIGSIYYLSDSFKVRSLHYFLNTVKYAGKGEDDTIIDAYYYLGNCYTLLKQYDLAISAFNKYLRHVDTSSRVNETILKEVQHNIEICKSAPTIIKRSADSAGYLLDGKLQPIYVKNMGGRINSPYADYSQVLMNHDSTIIFTSRRPASQGGKKDFMTDQYYEDVFISHIDSGRWQVPTLFSNQLHFNSSAQNFASVAITGEGNTLFMYNKGRIWESHQQKGGWSKLQKIGKHIRQIHNYIPSVFLSFDGKKLFLVSDKGGGYGGKDIYESDKNSDGTWGIPQNLGPTINTAYDEDSPYLMPDNKTLYFSSKGHAGLGGYDIFKSVYENGKWSTPVNLGAPINSPGDDIYFTYDSIIHGGFLSSSRVNEGYGNMDIYSYSFTCDNIENTQLIGEVVANGNKIKDALIYLTDDHHNTYTGRSDANGKYSISVKPDRTYELEVQIPQYLPFNTTLTLPHQCDAFNLYEVLNPTYKKDSTMGVTGQSMVVKNAFYRSVPNASSYKNPMDDANLASLITSYNEQSTKIGERDTIAIVGYTPAQRDSMNAKLGVPKYVDTTNVVMSPLLPKVPIVYFAFNKYNIESQYHGRLDSLASFVKKTKNVSIRIEGNTDTVGTAKYNQYLSVLRAKSVASYLEMKGVNAHKLHIQGNGKHHLAIPANGASGLNRRDDIIILKE